MAKLSALLDRVHDEFPAVPEALALRALSDTFKEFCSRTHTWQVQLPTIELVPGQAAYELADALFEVAFSQDLQFVSLVDVRMDGRKIYPLLTERPRLRSHTRDPGEVAGYIQLQPSAIELVDAPAKAADLSVLAAITLKLGKTGVDVPDDMLDEYGEAIAAGAKARLVRQAGQPWFAPDLVVSYAGPFYTAVNTAKGRTMTALGEAQGQVEMRRW